LALVIAGRGTPQSPGPSATTDAVTQGGDHREADTAAALAEPRRRADLLPCPTGGDHARSVLSGITVDCAADGSPVAVGAALAGRRVVLNLWAYWCQPCRAELPAMAEYQRRTGPEVTVVIVHQDENESAALLLL